MEPRERAAFKPEQRPRSIAFYVVLAAALYIVIQAYSLLSPILLSFLLIILITLAVNPIVSRLRTWTGGRKRATGLVLAGVLALGALTIWAAAVPLKHSVTTLSERLPAYWERLQSSDQDGTASRSLRRKTAGRGQRGDCPGNAQDG